MSWPMGDQRHLKNEKKQAPMRWFKGGVKITSIFTVKVWSPSCPSFNQIDTTKTDHLILLMAEIQLTTWDVWNPINNGINYLSTGAGFQPSTVCLHFRPKTRILQISPNCSNVFIKFSYRHPFLYIPSDPTASQLERRFHSRLQNGFRTWSLSPFTYPLMWGEKTHQFFFRKNMDGGKRCFIIPTFTPKTSQMHYINRSYIEYLG